MLCPSGLVKTAVLAPAACDAVVQTIRLLAIDGGGEFLQKAEPETEIVTAP
jgi:hypothetical protein